MDGRQIAELLLRRIKDGCAVVVKPYTPCQDALVTLEITKCYVCGKPFHAQVEESTLAWGIAEFACPACQTHYKVYPPTNDTNEGDDLPINEEWIT